MFRHPPDPPNPELELLRRIIDELCGDNGLLRLLAANSLAQTKLLQQIVDNTNPKPSITSFIITETTMPIAPGFSPVFTATPVPSTSVPATPPTWTTSDTTNAPITVDATGLVATVALPTTAVVGTSFTLTVSYTNADSTVATGSITETIVAAPSPDITSFTIVQTT